MGRESWDSQSQDWEILAQGSKVREGGVGGLSPEPGIDQASEVIAYAHMKTPAKQVSHSSEALVCIQDSISRLLA